MQIFVLRNDQQFGPYTEAQVRQALSEQEFSPIDLSWKEGCADWIPLSEMLGSEPPAESHSEEGEREPVDQVKPENHLSMLDKLKGSFVIGCKQTLRKKLELVDLRTAYFELGAELYRQNLATSETQKYFTKIAEVDIRLGKLASVSNSSADVTLEDKAKRSMGKVKDATKKELLLQERKNLLVALGKSAWKAGSLPTGLEKQAERIRDIESRITEIDGEIKALSKTLPFFLRRPLLVLFCGVGLYLASLCYGSLREAWHEYQVQKEMEEQREYAENEIARLDAEAKRSQLEFELGQQRAEEARRVKEAQRELKAQQDLQKREELRLAEQSQRQEAAEAEALKREEELKAQEVEKVIAEEREKLARQQEQRDREEAGSRLLSQIQLNPSVVLSSTLRRHSSSIELRGKDVEKLRSLQAGKQWLEMLSVMAEMPYTQFPPIEEVEKKINASRHGEINLFLKTAYRPDKLHSIYIISFPSGSRSLMIPHAIYQEHPDGTGYLTEWRPSMGRVVIVTGQISSYRFGKDRPVENELENFAKTARAEEAALMKKLSIGEITQEVYNTRFRDAQERIYNEICRWANGL